MIHISWMQFLQNRYLWTLKSVRSTIAVCIYRRSQSLTCAWPTVILWTKICSKAHPDHRAVPAHGSTSHRQNLMLHRGRYGSGPVLYGVNFARWFNQWAPGYSRRPSSAANGIVTMILIRAIYMYAQTRAFLIASPLIQFASARSQRLKNSQANPQSRSMFDLLFMATPELCLNSVFLLQERSLWFPPHFKTTWIPFSSQIYPWMPTATSFST
jgi:hypothetical protein